MAGRRMWDRRRCGREPPRAGRHARTLSRRQLRNGGSTDPCSKSWRSRRLGRGGQIEVEDGATGGRAAIADAAAERIDNAVADRQTEAGPLTDRLGREERLEQLGFVVSRNTGAGVFNF